MQTTMRQRFEKIDYLDIALWVLRIALIVAVLWGTVATILDNPYSTEQWLDFLVFGLAQGSLYALIALGYTLVYGVLLMINFAHGEFFMAGIFTATVFVAIPLDASGFTDRHPIWALLVIAVVAIATSIGIAVLTERVAYRPLRRAPRLAHLTNDIFTSSGSRINGVFTHINKNFAISPFYSKRCPDFYTSAKRPDVGEPACGS